MPETTKPKFESSEKDVDNTELKQDLQDIQEEKKKQSILSKLSDFTKKTFSRDKESTVGEEGTKDQSPRAEAISSFTDESGRVRGSIEEHKAEEQRIIAEREQSGQADEGKAEAIRRSELKRRAIEDMGKEHGYVKGGPEAIEAKMAEIEARDKANAENSDTFEKV